MTAPAESPSANARGWTLLTVGTVGAAACLTVLFLSMCSVMEVGGSCASGGPYEVAQPCPKGVAWLLPVSIWAGLAFVAMSVVGSARAGVPSIAWLGWPALFVSLGWNFFDFGFDPPGDATGPVWGWLVSGALFWAMGWGPVVLWLAQRRNDRAGREPAPPVRRAAQLGTRVRAATTPPPFRSDAEDLVDALERLAALHRRGAIDDDEYRAAKHRLLGGTR